MKSGRTTFASKARALVERLGIAFPQTEVRRLRRRVSIALEREYGRGFNEGAEYALRKRTAPNKQQREAMRNAVLQDGEQ